MIALWMAYATTITCVLGLAALALDRVAARWGGRRRWLWVAALAGAVVFPVWERVRASGSQPLDAAASTARAPQNGTDVVGFGRVGASLSDLLERARPQTLGLARLDAPLVVIWSVAAAFLFLAYAGAVCVLARARRRWRETLVDGEYVLVASAAGPAVVGALRPRIVLPEWALALPPDERTLVLAHEREHVRAGDPLLLHIAMVAVLAMPWNLAAWWLLRRLRLAVELDCDARVLGAGRDARTYGALLLDVCARRARGVRLLAPALLERRSSLSRRILAMHPRRPRFPSVHAAMSGAAALAFVVLACEAPSPEMLAPDGRDVAAQRLYGTTTNRTAHGASEIRALIGEYFPEVARGEGGPAILIFVRDADGEIVMTERGASDGSSRRAPGGEHGSAATVRGSPIPEGIGSLLPNEIESVEVVKHSAGKLAPNALSTIWIDLKPGARVPVSAAGQ